ncbi:MAG: PEP-CTERM sorting domain-containing protein [Gammaproteobacteria bacterium]
MKKYLACLLVLASLSAHAVPVTVNYDAEIIFVADDNLSVFGGLGITNGAQFDGSFTYDTDTTGVESAGAVFWTMSDFTANGLPGSVSPVDIAAVEDGFSDLWLLNANWDELLGSINIQFFGSGDLFAPGAVVDGAPVVVPDFSLITGGSISYFDGTGQFGQAFLSVELSSVPMASVPEPATPLLIGVALFAFAVGRKAKRF